jgi:hypothetical protein
MDETKEFLPVNTPPVLIAENDKLLGFYFATGKYWYSVFAYWRDGYAVDITGHLAGNNYIGNEKFIEQAIRNAYNRL